MKSTSKRAVLFVGLLVGALFLASAATTVIGTIYSSALSLTAIGLTLMAVAILVKTQSEVTK